MQTTKYASILRSSLDSILADEKPFSISDPQKWFVEYLTINHFIIRASVPLMEKAFRQLKDQRMSGGKWDDLERHVSDYYFKHIGEEYNHDVWLLEDLEKIGVSKDTVLQSSPPQSIMEMVGSQYYCIYHWSPIVLLGYIYVLEYNPPNQTFVKKMKKSTGFADSAFRTIEEHNQLDTSHGMDLDNLLNELPLLASEQVISGITQNAFYTASKYHQIIANIVLESL